MATYNAYQSQPYPYNTTGVPVYYNWQYNPNYTQPQYQQNVQPVQNQPMTQPQPAQTSQAGINWVQGEAGAKSFNVMAGQSVMLMDSENNVFYIKSTDASGMPLPLRIFDYTERNNDTSNSSTNITSNPNNEINMDEYVTRKEFEDLLSKIKLDNTNNGNNNRYNRKKGRNNDESSV